MAGAISGELRCILVAPEGQLADRRAEFVVLTAHDGQFGILPGRAEFLCKLGPGMLRIDEGGVSRFYFVAGGFAEVMDNTVTVVTTEALAADQIDIEAAKNELAQARKLPGKTDEEYEKRNNIIKLAAAKRDTYASYTRDGQG